MLAIVAATNTTQAQIQINAVNFPDEIFRNYLLSQPYGADGQLTDTEIQNITYLGFSNQNITNLKGIEKFTALPFLSCQYTPLTSLDVSGCTALTQLHCSYSKLTSLNVSGCTALTSLNCSYNKLTSLNVSGCTELQTIVCSYNQLTTLNISGCSALKSIGCEYNKIKASEMGKLVNSLPQNEYGGNFYAVLNGGDENEITQEQVEIARNKGWYVTYHIKNTSENSNSSNSNTNNGQNNNENNTNNEGTNTGSTTGLLNIENYNLKLYPNPTNNVLYVEEAGQEVLVYSSNGQIVLRQPTAASGPTRIDMGHLPTGAYLVRSGNAIAKVVKQ